MLTESLEVFQEADMPSAISVKQLNLYIKTLLEGDERLAFISVCGEISNFKHHYASGHLYFTLKDDSSALKCVMFKSNAMRLKFVPGEGAQVVCSGRVSVYERDGSYQLYVENIAPMGQGELLAALEKTKKRLEAEGLFATERKRRLPPFPEKIAVITSETGAAAHDIITILGRRFPLCKILFCPATVQGAQAPSSLRNALDIVAKSDAELVIIGRGGGSIEDLWCFNDEELVRKIAAMPIPVISAVGHETDYTLSDFAADLRAPTPSAAAELTVPDVEELRYNLEVMRRGMDAALEGKISSYDNALRMMMKRECFANTEQIICGSRHEKQFRLTEKINNEIERKLYVKEMDFCRVAEKLDALSPLKTMLRGYSVIRKDKMTVSSVDQIKENEIVEILFKDGKATATVDKIIRE